MMSFAITLYGQCRRRHIVRQQVVSDASVVRSCWSICCILKQIILICYYVCSLLYLECLFCFTQQTQFAL